MHSTHLISFFFSGVFLANAAPHLLRGVMGQPFQTPFAKPPGKGLSSSTINASWGFVNLAIGYLLLCRVGHFDLRSVPHILAVASGFLLMCLQAARYFGQFHGGNAPGSS